MSRRRLKKLLLLFVAVACVVVWLAWNHTTKVDMAGYVPAECSAFIEVNDLTALAAGIDQTEAWSALASSLGAPSKLISNGWWITLARWTGIGSADAVLAARSQLALVFTDAQATASDQGITIKPLAALVIETHTLSRRMKPALEKHVGQFAQRFYGQTVLTQKQIDGIDVSEWSTSDKSRTIVMAIVDTVAIVGNDESVVMRCVNVRQGRAQSLAADKQLQLARQQFAGSASQWFGFIPKAGVKPIVQAWMLNRAGASPAAATIARLTSQTLGNLIESIAWSSRFDGGGAEDRWVAILGEGVAAKLRGSMAPDSGNSPDDFGFVPPESQSVSLYRFRDTVTFWQDLNTVVSAHADALAAVASRPLLRSFLQPYGIEEGSVDAFVGAVGPRLQTIRLQNNAPAVLIAQAADRPSLRKVAQQRLGTNAKTETTGDAELMLSSTDNWSAAFVGNYFLIGPADSVRRCIQARSQSQSITGFDPFRRAQAYVDVSLPITALTFASDRQPAISFVELFGNRDRSAFSAKAAAIQQASQALPYSVSVTIIKANELEWTSRSSFGLLGSFFTAFAPESSR